MSRNAILLMSVLAISISGCGARDESQPLFGTPASASAIDETASENVTPNTGAATTDADAAESETQAASTLTVGNQDDNPGVVPSPILAELSSISLADPTSVLGHKIFAGYEVFVPATGLIRTPQFRFFNIDFPCNGANSFEGFVPADSTSSWPELTGHFQWLPTFADIASGNMEMNVYELLTGDPKHDMLFNGIDLYPLVYGDVIVGNTAIERLVVERIVQYEQCS